MFDATPRRRRSRAVVTSETADLFDDGAPPTADVPAQKEGAPLADRLRPQVWDDFLSDATFDRSLLAHLRSGKGRPPSLVLWGPPGTGKTTFARLVGRTFQCRFEPLSAVLAGVKEVREVVDRAKKGRLPTLLFIDEIHRFNKAQQDALLPHVESGAISLLGATTENPSFALTPALLSRVRVVVFPPLADDSLDKLLAAGLHQLGLDFDADARKSLAAASGGDGRRLLNLLEGFAQQRSSEPQSVVDGNEFRAFLADAKAYIYDREGDQHFDMISAFIKSLRGSSPDGALYWGFRMIESGEDPRYLCRRMMIFASEDVGNADPHALPMAVATADAFERLGIPEGKIPLAQCITYLATAPKSNRSYLAMHAAVDAVREHPRASVPVHLRNAPTKLMKALGHGADYQYPHDLPDGFVPGVQYLPDEFPNGNFYRPKDIGAEGEIVRRMKDRGQLREDSTT
jgi:putative ATPase